MNAMVRLWRRAPLWRWSCYATVIALALTVAFPPSFLQSGAPVPPLSPRSVFAAAQPPPAPTEAPRATPPTEAGLPAAGSVFSGRLPLGAQSLPLPPGRWMVIAVSPIVAPTGPPGMNAFLALVVGGRVVAAVVVSASTAPDQSQAGFPPMLELQSMPIYYRRVLSAVDHGAVDVWVCGTIQPSRWADPLHQAAVAAIRQQGLVFPDRLDSALFRMSDKRNWIYADFMFTDPIGGPDVIRPWIDVAADPETAPLSHMEKVRRWGKAWHDVMRRAFAGQRDNQSNDAEDAHIPLP